MLEKYLDSPCADKGYCNDPQCKHAIKKSEFGRWFITMGHAGFNSVNNNNIGYATKRRAKITMQIFLGSNARTVVTDAQAKVQARQEASMVEFLNNIQAANGVA